MQAAMEGIRLQDSGSREKLQEDMQRTSGRRLDWQELARI